MVSSPSPLCHIFELCGDGEWESIIGDITSLLSVSDVDERIRMIGEPKGVLQRELMRTHFDVSEMSCPVCGCAVIHRLMTQKCPEVLHATNILQDRRGE